MIGSSALLFHLSSVIVRSSAPDIGEVLKQNPALMGQAMGAMMQQMGRSGAAPASMPEPASLAAPPPPPNPLGGKQTMSPPPFMSMAAPFMRPAAAPSGAAPTETVRTNLPGLQSVVEIKAGNTKEVPFPPPPAPREAPLEESQPPSFEPFEVPALILEGNVEEIQDSDIMRVTVEDKKRGGRKKK